jgi:hypothetical protein
MSENQGRYSQRKRQITQPLAKVDLKKVPYAPRVRDTVNREDSSTEEEFYNKVVAAVVRLDQTKLVLNKRRLSLLTSLVVTMLGAMAYGGTEFMMRSAQLEDAKEEIRELHHKVDLLHKEDLAQQRKLVELETQLKNLNP